MAWRIVKQPNGKFARFSDIVDNFTHIDMTKDEAVEVCREDLGRQDAIDKVERALTQDDTMESGLTKSPDGLRRWRDSLRTIARVHGKQEAGEAEKIGKQSEH